jgi:hypothetical protein
MRRRRMLKGWDVRRIGVHRERNALLAPTTDKTYTTYGTNRGRPTSPIGPTSRIAPIRCWSQSAFLPTRDANALRRSDRQRISVEFLLVPVRVNQRYGTGSVEFPDLVSGQVPTDGS